MLLLHTNLFSDQLCSPFIVLDLFSHRRNLFFQKCIHRRKDIDVENIFDDCSSICCWQLHEGNERRTTKNHNLSERLVVHTKNLLFQHSLIVLRLRVLIDEFSVLVNLKHLRFQTTNYLIGNIVHSKLNLHQAILLIDGVDELWNVDLSKRLTKQSECDRIEKCE